MNVFLNGQPREVASTSTVADLVSPGGATPRGIAVALDGAVVPRAAHAGTPLYEGARVEIVTAVQGG